MSELSIEEVAMLLGKKDMEIFLLEKKLRELSEKIAEIEKSLE